MAFESIHKGTTGKLLKVISESAQLLGTEAFVIGGFVRDSIMGRSCKDIDVVTTGNGIELAQKAADLLNVKKVSVFKTYGTAMFMYKDWQVEFVGARKESYTSDSRNPVVAPGTIEDDQNRRDFTINALALSLNPLILDSLLIPFMELKTLKPG